MCSSPTRGTEHFVYATGDIKDPVPSCGRFPPSFIHQVIIITRLNKLYNCMSRPEDGLRCRQGIKPPLELTPLDLQIIKLNKYTDIERYNKYSNKLVCDMAISIGFGGKRGDSHQHSCCCARADITLRLPPRPIPIVISQTQSFLCIFAMQLGGFPRSALKPSSPDEPAPAAKQPWPTVSAGQKLVIHLNLQKVAINYMIRYL